MSREWNACSLHVIRLNSPPVFTGHNISIRLDLADLLAQVIPIRLRFPAREAHPLSVGVIRGFDQLLLQAEVGPVLFEGEVWNGIGPLFVSDEVFPVLVAVGATMTHREVLGGLL